MKTDDSEDDDTIMADGIDGLKRLYAPERRDLVRPFADCDVDIAVDTGRCNVHPLVEAGDATGRHRDQGTS